MFGAYKHLVDEYGYEKSTTMCMKTVRNKNVTGKLCEVTCPKCKKSYGYRHQERILKVALGEVPGRDD